MAKEELSRTSSVVAQDPGDHVHDASVGPPHASGLQAAAGVLQIRDFRFLLIGNALMFAGFQVRNMGQAWLVLELTDSSLWVGIVNAMPGIAIILVSLLGGAAADRYERWRIQVLSRLVIAVMAFTTAFLVTSGVIQAWQLIPIGLITGTMFAFHNPAGQAFAVDVVGRERLMSAISINTTISQTAMIVGPAAAGFLLAAGLDAAFYLLGTLYAIAFLTTLAIRKRSAPSVATRNLRKEISDGVRYAAGNEVIKYLLVISAGGIFTGIFQAVTPLFARNILDVGEIGYGTMLAVQGAGSLSGALALVIAGDVKNKGAVIFGSMIAMNAAMVVFAASETYALSLAMMFFVGIGIGVWFIIVPTLIQTHSDSAMRGRVMSIFL